MLRVKRARSGTEAKERANRESSEMGTINYETGATVRLLLPPSAQAPAGGGIMVWSGTLADAIRHFKAMPSEEQALASISLDGEAGLGKTWLEPADIEAISRRPDFPLARHEGQRRARPRVRR
jgi:hypothetical protein